MCVEIGQVLSLRIRFNNNGDISSSKHPYLIVDINDEFNTVEIAQIDSLQGKEYKALFRGNKVILCDNPRETVIDKDSYVQLDNTIIIENFPSLSNYRRQPDKLSAQKLASIANAYSEYHKNNEIEENKIVFMDADEINALN